MAKTTKTVYYVFQIKTKTKEYFYLKTQQLLIVWRYLRFKIQNVNYM